MSALILVRHGETNLAGRFCGQIDPPLNEAGNLQAAQAAREVAQLGIARIHSSSLLRARQTAEKIAQSSGREIELLPELREIGFGAWEGLDWTEIEARWPQESRRWAEEFPHRSAPQGEPYAEFCARVDSCIASIASTVPMPVAVVTHRGVMLRVLTRFFGYSEQQARTITAPYCAEVVLEIDPAKGLR